ncbi:hypothetical protein DPX39_010033800 [Trypanosoma brucei equiperdum]|uniref:Uncharacterized protein n=1 Tax=Trypanosoma brucei equiperdum TaxID=630700 RepID=A0A3L6LD35_9TRYP|nr:hypothetical protein DPX39_010033800 [Trypanosoma brucei equiperdum]
MSAFALATRGEPVSWEKLVVRALSFIDATPSVAATNALHALTSYSASPPSIYCDAAAGVRNAKLHSGLLLSLHHATAQWPKLLRHMLAPPPVIVGDQSLSISGPAMELFVVLYNASVSNCEAGFAAMSRAHADAARTGMMTAAETPSSSPLANSKSAFKSFTMGAELAFLAEQALAEGGDELLPAVDRHSLQKQLDFRSIHELAELCVATAKYVYSTTSGAVSKKHDTLAKLAYAAATTAVPLGLKAMSLLLTVMSRLLTAAYHRHMAEHYYRLDKVPDMSLVLGHIMYAMKLLKKIQVDCPAVLRGHATSQKAPPSSSSDAMRSVRQLLGQISASIVGNGGTGAKEQGCQSISELADLLEEGDMMKVFPLAGSLVRDVAKLHEKYQHENSVVYYSRPASDEEIKDDVPEAKLLDVASDSIRYSSNREELLEALAKRLDTDLSKFAELPAPDELASSLEGREMMVRVRDKLKALQQLTADAKETLSIPHFVEPTLTQLESLLQPYVKPAIQDRGASRNDEGSGATTDSPCPLDSCLDAAVNNVEEALSRHLQVSNGLYRAKCEYIGEYVGPFEVTETLKNRQHAWLTRVHQLRSSVRSILIHHDKKVELRETLLLPESTVLQPCLANAVTVVERARDLLSSLEPKRASRGTTPPASDNSSDEQLSAAARLQVLLETLCEADGSLTAAFERAQPLRDETRWARVAGVLREAAELIGEGNNIVSAAVSATDEMEKQQSRIVVHPIERLQDVVFETPSLPGQRKRRGKQAEPPRQRMAAPTKQELEGASCSTTEQAPCRKGKNRHTGLGEKAEVVEGVRWSWPSTVEKGIRTENTSGAESPADNVAVVGSVRSTKRSREGTPLSPLNSSVASDAAGQLNIPEAEASPLFKRRIKELNSGRIGRKGGEAGGRKGN